MIRQYCILLASLVCLTLLSACTQIPKPENTVVVPEADSVAVSTEQEHSIDRAALETAVAECYELQSYEINFGDIELRENIIYVPLSGGNILASAEVHINDDSSYSLTSVEYFDSDPDGWDFADRFGSFAVDCKEAVIQCWDTGKDVVRFKTYTDKEKGHIFEINGHAVDCIHVTFKQILVEDEYIIVITGGTDINTSVMHIFDYEGNTLFKTYYLSNTGMVITGSVTVDGSTIIIKGTRTTHGPCLMIGKLDYGVSEYADHLYEDTVYDYGEAFLPYDEVYLDMSNEEELKKLNPNEKTSAVFEMEYLGDGRFSKLRMTDFRILKMDMPDVQWDTPVDPCTTGTKLYLKSDDGVSIDVEASYPTVHLPDSTVSDKINKVIKDFIDSNYAVYYDRTTESARDTVHSRMTYEVTLFNDVKLSIHFSASFAGSGAAQIVKDTAFTFDLQTGELIPLSALCGQGELTDAINGYFDGLDEEQYPALFSMYSKEKIRNDFLGWFDSESEYFDFADYNSYYITEDRLYLFAGHYKGYTADVDSPLEGDRAFAVSIDRAAIPEFGITDELRDAVAAFSDAYMKADIESAISLMDSEENKCLEYFPTAPAPIEMKSLELICEKRLKDSEGGYTEVNIDIPIFRKDLGDVYYMCLTLVKRDTADGRWIVTNFNFEA